MGMISILLALGVTVTAGQDPTEKKAFVLPHVLEAVGQAIDTPAPKGLSAADQKAYAAQTEWLKSVKKRIEPLAAESDVKTPRDPATGQASGKRQYQPVLIRKKWETLQATIEQEARRYENLQGAMKARHDIAMNAIRNMKA